MSTTGMTDLTSYVFSYNEFLLREAYGQERMIRCINEAVSLVEGSYDREKELHAFNEGFTDLVKGAWAKFTNAFNKVYQKFVERANSLVSSFNTKGYLEKYQSIIKTQPLKFEQLEYRNYNMQMMVNTHAMKFDIDQFKDIYITTETNNTEDDIVAMLTAKYFKKIASAAVGSSEYKGGKETNDIREFLEERFCNGSKEDVPMLDYTRSHMTDIYNFCHDFETRTKLDLEKDRDAVLASGKVMDNLLASLEKQAANTAKEEEKNKQPQGGGEGTTGTPKGGGEITVQPAAAIWLDTPFKPLFELNMGGGTNTKSSKINTADKVNGPQATGGTGSFAKAATGVDGKGMDQSARDQLADDAAKDEGLRKGLPRAVNVYKNVNGAICSAKMNICISAFKDYMTIIRQHVASHIGEEKQDGVAQTATVYTRQNQPAAAGNGGTQ